MATWLIGGGLAVVVGLIVAKMIRDKRSGKGHCGGGCGGGCPGCRGGDQ